MNSVKNKTPSVSSSEVQVRPKEKEIILQCDFCDETFNHKRLKMLHMQVHHRESDGNYRCNWCGALVKEKGWNAHRTRELNKLTGSASKTPVSYPCTRKNCNSQFTRAEALRDHMNEHDDIYPNLCQFCGMAYCRKSSLNKHIKTSHPYT